MKLLVIGHSVEDYIHQGENVKVRPGGIYHSVKGILSAADPNDEIHLLTALEKNKFNLYSDAYNRLSNVIVNWVDKIPKVHLFIHDSGERAECYEILPKNLEVDYSLLQNYDGIFLNMISGNDVRLEQLKLIRQNFKSLIYFDVHTFSRGFDENNNRVFRKIKNFEYWAANLDIIQANEVEAKTLFGYEDEIKTAADLLNCGIKCFIVTKGETGARVYFKKDTEIGSIFTGAEKIMLANKVGCGDFFGSIFFHTFLKTNDVMLSLKKANHSAGKFAEVENSFNLVL